MNFSLKPSTAGIQYAGWEPAAVAQEGLGNRVLASQQIPVAGAELNADVYLPKAPGSYPAVVSFGAYETETHTAGIPTGSNEIGSPPVFTDRGYAPVIVERRGMGRSGGEALTLFGPQDVDDHEAVIAWAAAQPWCNGEVVLFGTSYYAVTQLFVAARRPSALKALFVNEVCTDLYRHLIAFGNVPGSFFLGLWMGANFTEAQENLRIAPNARALASHLTNGPAHALLERGVHRNAEKLFASFLKKTPDAFYRKTYTDWVFDEKTRSASTAAEVTRAMLRAIEVPIVTVQNLGYLNLHQFGSYEIWDHVGAAEKYLILAPHSYDLPVYSWQGEALAFFDHVLRGTDNGYAAQPSVRYWVDGADSFAAATSFPPPGTATRLYLGEGLSETETAEGTAQWVAVPFGTPVLPGLDEEAPQTVSFDLPVAEDRTFAGAITANLTFSCNEIDSYVIARLSRVEADGTTHLLSLGAIRPITRRIDPTRGNSCEIALDADVREPLVPGEPALLRFSLTPAPVRLRASETLRLDLGSRTDLLRGSIADGYVHFDMPVPPYLCRNTVHLGGQSWIEVTEL